MAPSVLHILSRAADADGSCSAEELTALADHVRRHGADDFFSVGIQTRFPEIYAAAIQSPRKTP